MSNKTVMQTDSFGEPDMLAEVATVGDLVRDLGLRIEAVRTESLRAELAAVSAMVDDLIRQVRALDAVAASGLDLRRHRVPTKKLISAVIAQRGPVAAANFATRLAKACAVRRGALRMASGGQIKV
jgi:hypothetical protein